MLYKVLKSILNSEISEKMYATEVQFFFNFDTAKASQNSVKAKFEDYQNGSNFV